MSASDLAGFPAKTEILNPPALAADIETAIGETQSPAEARAALVAVLRDHYQRGRSAIEDQLRAQPQSAPTAIPAISDLTDGIVRAAFQTVTQTLHPLANPTASESIALLAVGGYGRAEMAPFSDVDLLFLTPYKQTPWGESVIESVLYTLWDLRLKVGHAVRTVDDCIRLGTNDTTIRTALLEHRHIAGDRELSRSLDRRLWKELFSKTGSDFVEAKLAEREERHERHGGARYVVEPNVKEGKGGLRDLQTLFWIAKYLNHVNKPADLVTAGVFRPEEFRVFREAEQFLWAVRCQLHLAAGRAQEQLSFNYQVEIAQRMGFEDRKGMRAVEAFMQSYFLHAKNVGDLTRVFLTGLEARHVKARPSLGRSLLNVFSYDRQKAPQGFKIENGRLNIGDPAKFLSDPVNLLRLFEEGLRSGLLIHPDAMRLVARNLNKVDDRLRNDPEANRIFLETLLSHQNPERALRRMNELGFLGAFIPEFGRIVAMMQFNMYHHYTVDEHTIQCISNLFQIERGELEEDLPIASEILAKGVNRRVIYVALMLHDIGKGLPERHEEVGARIAQTLCPRLGLDEEETQLVEWLVLNHLEMSDFAQKRDLADPRTVRDFAQIVQSPMRLKLLTVLTVCDIRGVGPGVWNNWKAVLLRQLYRETLDHLSGRIETQSRPEREAEAKDALRGLLTGWEPADLNAECERHYLPYWIGLDPESHKVFAELIRDFEPGGIGTSFAPDPDRDATRVCFVMEDHPGIFGRLAGALALVGANVVEARTFTSSDGIATAVFWIQDAEGSPYEESRLPRLDTMVRRSLKGEIVTRDVLRERAKFKVRERDFTVPTTISFDNEGSEIYTIIEVDTRDRIGLLHDIARTLTECNVSIASAIIATYGEQAVDSFYVKDLFGLKLHSESKRRSVEAKLRAAIEAGKERALA